MSIEQNINSPLDKNSTNNLPKIGITIGDPAGIGPEVVVKTAADKSIQSFCSPVIVGDLNLLRKTARSCAAEVEFVGNNEGGGLISDPATVSVFDLDNLPEKIEPGKPSAVSGKASVEYIEAAVRLWKHGEIDAITTAPINKKAVAMGGFSFPGHTELLAELTGTKDFAMSFFAGDLCVVLLSTHVSLLAAIDLVKADNIARLIRFTNEKLSVLLRKEVKIAVAGLNPHASEDGMFGSEEEAEIAPAIKECRVHYGIDVSGPFAPDTIFLRGYKGEFDAVVSCYHDQATIAVKCLSFGDSVNVTLGLPFIRTSVDHGTAYDIAGKNLADSSSLKAAVKLGAHFVDIRNRS